MVEVVSPLGRLRRAARLVDARIAEVAGDHGLERRWLDVLSALRAADRELSPTELLGPTALSPGGMTKLLDRLEATGLVRRFPNPVDRRGVAVRLTGKGRRLADRAIAAQHADESAMLRRLSDAERATLDDLLHQLLTRSE